VNNEAFQLNQVGQSKQHRTLKIPVQRHGLARYFVTISDIASQGKRSLSSLS